MIQGNQKQPSATMKQPGRLWRGELPLDTVFWNWAVFGGLIINVTSSVGFVLLVVADQPIAALMVGYLLSVPYNIAVLVGVWRSAERYEGERRWADLAKLITVVGAIVLSIT